MNLEDLYHRACTTPGNINEHLPLLRTLATECDSVVEFGTNEAISTTALLAAQPWELTTFDLNPSLQAEALREHSGMCRFDVRLGDSRYIEPVECDLLLIDSLHTREQLELELSLHARGVRRWIALHDTVTFGERGEDGGLGLLPAMRNFLQQNPPWRVVAHWTNNNGMTLLRRSAQ